MNAVLVKRRCTEGDETGGADVHVFNEGSVVTEGRDNVNENQQQGYVNQTTEIDKEVHEPLEKDRQLEQMFEEELSKLKPICDITDEPRERLLKVKITREKEQSANRILFWKRRQIADVGQIVDAVYAMGLALIRSMGVKRKAPGQGKKNGNRRERKITNKMKELRQWIARAGNEIYRRKTRRRATVKKKKIAKELKERIGIKTLTSSVILRMKEKWLDELRHLKVKMEKAEKRKNRVRNNAIFQEDEGRFYKSMENRDNFTGRIPHVEEFVTFWTEIWEHEPKTPHQPWMDKIMQELRSKVKSIKDFKMDERSLKGIIRNRKNWTAPGGDGIQNYWWKRLTGAWRPLLKALQNMNNDPELIPTWLATGRTNDTKNN